MSNRRVENYLRVGEDLVSGDVSIDGGRCSGCTLCALACPAGALELVEGLPRMGEGRPPCIACGDCVAICPDEAIALIRFFELRRRFRYLNRGEPSEPRRF